MNWYLATLWLLLLYTLRPASLLDPLKERYRAHSHPVYFRNELKDVVFFSGSTIQLDCEANCEPNCISEYKVLHNRNFLYGNRVNFITNPGKYTVNIFNASINDTGIYQCKKDVWPRLSHIAGREANVQMAVIGPTLQEVKLLSMGDSVFLPCHVNTSNNIYPVPDHVEWWRDGTLCSSLSCGDDTVITKDNSILLRNTTKNTSFNCMVYWDNVHNTTFSHQIVITQQGSDVAVRVYPESSKVKVNDGIDFVCVVNGHGRSYDIEWRFINDNFVNTSLLTQSHVLNIPNVQLNNSGKYECIVSGKTQRNTVSGALQVIEPPHITNITGDVLIDINNTSRNDIILKCVFTGNPTPSVYWRMERRNELINLTHNTTIIGNTVILTLTITDNLVRYLGSYQCIVISEAGYFSQTTRILPKGWTSRPKNLKANFLDDKYDMLGINITWDPPDYVGGVPIRYYKLMFCDQEDIDESVVLKDSINTTYYFWDGLDSTNSFSITFKVLVVDEEGRERSDTRTTNILTERDLPFKLQLSVDCVPVNVVVHWELNYSQYLYVFDGYHLNYWCNSNPGQMLGGTVRDNQINSLTVTGVPLNATCWFMLTTDGVEISSNNVSCSRVSPNITVPVEGETLTIQTTTVSYSLIKELSLVPSVIVVDVKDQTQVEGYSVNFTCQATGEPVPTISWYFNDVPVNMSTDDKHNISTMSVNETSINSRLIVKSVKSSDVGTYTCKATNILSTDISSGVLSVNVSPNITVPVEGETVTIIEGGNITCTATGYPVPDIVWLDINGSEVDKTRLVTSSVMATGVGNVSIVSVSMIEVMKGDGGVYTCLATNPVGDDNTTVNVNVQFPSVIVVDVKDQTQVEGYSVNFTCQATGEPVPTISWYFNDVPVNMSTDDKHNISTMSVNETSINSRLIVKSVKSSDVGTYTCKATNILSTDNSSGVLSVNVPSVIVVDVKDQTQVEGYSVNFTCQATGEPVPTISWYFNDVPVNMSTDDKHNISTMSVNETSINSRLIVKSVKSSDVGTYTCKATNILLSTDISSGVLSVNVSPNITVLEGETVTIIEGGNITCTATGYPVPDIVWLYINGSEVDKTRLVTSSVMVTGVGNVSIVSVSMIEVMRGDSGVYTCLATNPVGDDNTTVSVNVQSILQEGSTASRWYLSLPIFGVIALGIFSASLLMLFIKKRRKNFSYDPPVDLDDETIKGSTSDVESVIGDREFGRCHHFIEDSDPEKMYDDIVHPSIDSMSVTSSDIDLNCGTFSRESVSHYYDSNNDTGNSTRTSQYDGSGNPVIDYSSSGSVTGVGYSSNVRTP